MTPPDLFNLSDRVALVTGAARGLGEASARTLAGLGATVILCDIDADAVDKTAEHLASLTASTLLPRVCDVTDADSVDSLVSSIIAEFGRLDILVNNAGIHRRVDPLDYDPADIEAILDVNFRGAFQVAARVGREMTAAGRGSIINISALGGGIAGLGRGGWSWH